MLRPRRGGGLQGHSKFTRMVSSPITSMFLQPITMSPPGPSGPDIWAAENHDRQKLRGTGVNLHVIHTAKPAAVADVNHFLIMHIGYPACHPYPPSSALFLYAYAGRRGYVEAEEFLMDKISSAHRPPPHALREIHRPSGRKGTPSSISSSRCRLPPPKAKRRILSQPVNHPVAGIPFGIRIDVQPYPTTRAQRGFPARQATSP